MSLDSQLAEFHHRLKHDADNPRLWIDYAEFVETNYEHPAEVVRAYERAAALLPHKDLRLRLGQAYLDLGEVDKGLDMLRQSEADNPRVTAWCFLSDACCKLGDEASARKYAERAIETEPSFEEAHYLLGEAVRSTSREDAIGHYRRAIELDPEYALAWHALGRELAARCETIEEALAALQKSQELDGDNIWNMLFLANANWTAGRHAEADHWYRQAIEQDPDDADLRRWYDDFLAATREE